MKNLKLFIKGNLQEIIIVLTTFFIMILFTYIDAGTFDTLHLYFTNEESKTHIIANANLNGMNVIPFILLSPFSQKIPFDQTIIWGTIFFQLTITLIASSAVLIFYKKHSQINQFKYYRSSRYRSKILKEILKVSFKVSISIFIGYLLFYLLTIKTGSMPSPDNYIDSVYPRTILLDLLGNTFYIESPKIYWLLEGTIRFLYVPFIYSTTSCIVVLFVKSAKLSYLIVNGYFFLLSALAGALSTVASISKISHYINPSVIMASGTYYLSTIPLLLTSLTPLIIALILFIAKRDIIYD